MIRYYNCREWEVPTFLSGAKTQIRTPMKPQPTLGLRGDGSVIDPGYFVWHSPKDGVIPLTQTCRYRWAEAAPYAPGDIICGRETWADVNSDYGPSLAYRADHAVVGWRDFSETFGPDEGIGPSFDYEAYKGDWCMWYQDLFDGADGHGWRPSIHMPRWAARIWLRVVDVRVERVQDISEADAIAEGCKVVDKETRKLFVFPNTEYDRSGLCHSLPSTAFCIRWDEDNRRPTSEDNPWVWVVTVEKAERPTTLP